MRPAQIQGVEKQTLTSWWEELQAHITKGMVSGRGGELGLFVRSVYQSLSEMSWSRVTLSLRAPSSSPLFFSLSHVWISSRKYMEALRAACSLIAIMREASLRTRTTHKGRQTRRIAEEKCHSSLDHVDIWIKPTLPLGFTDTCASKFWYHSSLRDWNFLFETKRHLSDTAI